MSLLSKLKALLSDTRAPEPDDLVTVRTFDTAGEAYVAKTTLEANGIPAMVENEGENYAPQIKKGVSVVIFYRDWDRVHKLLSNME